MRKVGSEWSEEEDEILRENLKKGISAREIAKLLMKDRTRNSVIGRAHRLGLSNQGYYRITQALVSKARAAAMPKREPKIPKTVPAKIYVLPKAIDPPSPDERAFARPWEAREARQCAWPLDGEGGTWSCCAPTEAVYCRRHEKKMFTPGQPERYTRKLPSFVFR